MISPRRTAAEIEHQQRDRWLLSYADLVTLLLALFIVLYAASNHERAAQIAQSFATQNSGGDGVLPEQNSPKDDRHRYEEKLLANPLLIQKTKMQQTARGLTISLSEAGFFAPGDATINADSINVIKTIAENLQNSRAEIRVEGHTDSTPIANARYPSNWELSTARASTVLVKLTENGIAPERLSAAGYGGFQPIADNSTPDGRAQNRRVDIVVLNR